jgi:hypothetical protein
MRVVAVTKRDNLPSINTCHDLVLNKPYDYHVKLLRPFHYDAESVNPDTIALADNNSYLVEETLIITIPSKMGGIRRVYLGTVQEHLQATTSS